MERSLLLTQIRNADDSNIEFRATKPSCYDCRLSFEHVGQSLLLNALLDNIPSKLSFFSSGSVLMIKDRCFSSESLFNDKCLSLKRDIKPKQRTRNMKCNVCNFGITTMESFYPSSKCSGQAMQNESFEAELLKGQKHLHNQNSKQNIFFLDESKRFIEGATSILNRSEILMVEPEGQETKESVKRNITHDTPLSVIHHLRNSLSSLYPTGLYEKLFVSVGKELMDIRTKFRNVTNENIELEKSLEMLKKKEQTAKDIKQNLEMYTNQLQGHIKDREEQIEKLTSFIEALKSKDQQQLENINALEMQLSIIDAKERKNKADISRLEMKSMQLLHELEEEKLKCQRVTTMLEQERHHMNQESLRQRRKFDGKSEELQLKAIQMEGLRQEIEQLHLKISFLEKCPHHPRVND